MEIRKVDPVLREWYDARIWEDGSGVRHEQHEDDHVEEQHVDGPPKRVVEPRVHDEPSKDSGFRLVWSHWFSAC